MGGTNSRSIASRGRPSVKALEGVKGRIAAVAGVLVAVAALVNGGIDIYAAAAKLPRSDAEQQNVNLFKKYFGKAPLVVNALPISSSLGVVEMKFSVYSEGDVFVEYGSNSQWFAIAPSARKSSSSLLDIIPSAFAQAPPPREAMREPGRGYLRQSEKLEGSVLTRRTELEGSRVEEIQYDIRSGKIINRSMRERDSISGEGFQRIPGTTRLDEIQVNRDSSGG